MIPIGERIIDNYSVFVHSVSLLPLESVQLHLMGSPLYLPGSLLCWRGFAHSIILLEEIAEFVRLGSMSGFRIQWILVERICSVSDFLKVSFVIEHPLELLLKINHHQIK